MRILNQIKRKNPVETSVQTLARKRRTPILFFILPLPGLIALLMFSYLPMVGLYIVFERYTYQGGLFGSEFVGLKNYATLFRKEEFLQVLGNTFTFTFITVGITLCLAMLFAIWLNHNSTIHRFVQAAIFSPHIIALVSVAFVWMWMMDPNYGLLNYAARLVGLPESKWLQSPDTAMKSIIITSVWKLIGYDTLILIAALQSIPKSIFEAAELDNAPKAVSFFKIILPMVSPSLFFLLVMNTLSMFQNFDTIAVMTQGGPLGSTNTLVYYIYQNAFTYYKLGYASAAGTVLTVIVGIMTIIYFRLLGKKVHYQ